MYKLMSVVMVIMLIPGALALSASGTEEVIQAKAMAVAAITLPVLDCEIATDTIFAMDVSQGQNPDNVEPFLNFLMGAGYYVATVDVSTAGGIASLSCADVLYVTSIKNNFGIDNSYPTADINTIENYVMNGGGFLYTSDWGTFAAKTKDLAERFGIYVDSNQVQHYVKYDTNNHWPIYDAENFFVASPIFAGVEEHVQLAGTSFLVANTPLIPIVRSDDDPDGFPPRAPVMAAGFYEQGCVIATGDSNWLHTYSSADGFNRADNPQLALNMVDFLVGCNPDDVVDPDEPPEHEIPEFGVFAALGVLIITTNDLPGWARGKIATVGANIAVVGAPDSIAEGDYNVLLDGLPVAREGDSTAQGGVIVEGSTNIYVNGKPVAIIGGQTVNPMVTGVVPHVGGPITNNP